MLKSEYTPNFSDPRVRSRCLRAIGFVTGVMSETKERSWSTRYIDLYLGNQRNDLSKWLRSQLLTVTDDFYKFNSGDQKSICKKYLLNARGSRNLRDKLEIDTHSDYPIVVEVIRQDHSEELSTGDFTYQDKSNRLWHPLQRYRKEHKRQVLEHHDFKYHYDIECCAPTLIHQFSQQIPEVVVNNKWLQGPMDQYLEHIDYYLRNRQTVRQELAQGLQLPTAAAKEIINALFCGATISNNRHSDIYHIVMGDSARIVYLQQHEFIQNLIREIRVCWSCIRPIMQKRTKRMPSGREKLCRITCRQRWQVYFQQERRVLDVIRVYLEQNDVKYFLEHDGWSSSKAIDLAALQQFVFDRTGYRLNFDFDTSSEEFDNQSH